MTYVFICVDTQNDYFNGVFTPITASIRENLRKITDASAKFNIKTLYLRGWYPNNHKFFSENPDFIKTFPKRCISNTNGANFIPETTPKNPILIDWEGNTGLNIHEIHQKKDIIVNKSTFFNEKTGFSGPFEGNFYLNMIINNLGVMVNERPTFVIYGVNIGPTVLDILKQGYKVMVIDDVNVNYDGYKLTRSQIIPEIVPQEVVTGGLLNQQSSGSEYQQRIEDDSLTFLTLKELIGE